MINVLLSMTNFGSAYAYYSLRRIIKKRHKVLILPLAYHENYINSKEEFDQHLNRDSDEMREVINSFKRYGIPDRNIDILHFYDDDNDRSIERKFKWADILFFTGGYPDKLMNRINYLDIRHEICNFDGIVMGASAGAMIQLDYFHLTPEDDDDELKHMYGLKLVRGLDIEVHYHDSKKHAYYLMEELKQHPKTILAIPNDGGAIVKNGTYRLFGRAFEVNEHDIDVLRIMSEDYPDDQ